MNHPSPQRVHGGPDGQGAVRWDFSVNSHPAGPCPLALAAVQQADPTQYPDPAYTALRLALAAFHGVAPQRVLLAASGSEAIARLSARVAQRGGRSAWWPGHAYGDYAHHAQAWGLLAVPEPAQAALCWLAEPSSPLGQAEPLAERVAQLGQTVVLDRAYEPLRLSGAPSLPPALLDRVWQLWTPNKALGLVGVRGAYAIAPLGAEAEVQALERLAPSWPLGAHAVAMLAAWVRPDTQQWLARSLPTLRAWKAEQMHWMTQTGWTCQPSDTPFFCAHPPRPLDAAALRARGLRLRDATSFGLPGWWRLRVMAPEAQAALRQAIGVEVPA